MSLLVATADASGFLEHRRMSNTSSHPSFQDIPFFDGRPTGINDGKLQSPSCRYDTVGCGEVCRCYIRVFQRIAKHNGIARDFEMEREARLANCIGLSTSSAQISCSALSFRFGCGHRKQSCHEHDCWHLMLGGRTPALLGSWGSRSSTSKGPVLERPQPLPLREMEELGNISNFLARNARRQQTASRLGQSSLEYAEPCTAISFGTESCKL